MNYKNQYTHTCVLVFEETTLTFKVLCSTVFAFIRKATIFYILHALKNTSCDSFSLGENQHAQVYSCIHKQASSDQFTMKLWTFHVTRGCNWVIFVLGNDTGGVKQSPKSKNKWTLKANINLDGLVQHLTVIITEMQIGPVSWMSLPQKKKSWK